MKTAHYPNLTQLWHKEMMKQLFATPEELDFVTGLDTIRYDRTLHARSMEFDFDMGRDLWLTKARFTTLQRTYLELYELETFLERCESIGLGDAKRGVVTELPAKIHARSARKYRWGNCMLGWTYRGGDRYGPPTLTMHSRVSYIAYIGGLDLALCCVLAREIGNRIGKKPEEFEFIWKLDSSQFHFFKSIPALFRFGVEDEVVYDEKKWPNDKYPTIGGKSRGVRKWWRTAIDFHAEGKPLDAEKYGPFKRIRRRYEENLRGEALPSVPLSELTFDPLRR